MPRETIIPDKFTPEHDFQYFEILSKSVFQAGFSFEVVERNWPGIREAFLFFDPKEIAVWSEMEVMELLDHPDVIKNIRKIRAIIHNAGVFNGIVDTHGNFAAYLASVRSQGYTVMQKELSKKFKWIGNTGAYVFLYTVNENVPKWENR